MLWIKYQWYYESDTGYRVTDQYKNKPVIVPYRISIGMLKGEIVFLAHSPDREYLLRRSAPKDDKQKISKAVNACKRACENHYRKRRDSTLDAKGKNYGNNSTGI